MSVPNPFDIPNPLAALNPLSGLGGFVLGVGSTLLNALELSATNFIGDIQVDTAFEEIYEDALEVTEHPVEAQANITDHSFKKPMEFSLVCGWSNASASGLAQFGVSTLDGFGVVGAAQQGNAFIGGSGLVNPGANTFGQFSGGKMAASDYVAGIYSQLLQLQESRETLTLVTGLRVYDTMLMTSLRIKRDQRTRFALAVQAMFRQVILVDTQVAAIPPQANQAIPANTADIVNSGSRQLQLVAPSIGGAFPAL